MRSEWRRSSCDVCQGGSFLSLAAGALFGRDWRSKHSVRAWFI